MVNCRTEMAKDRALHKGLERTQEPADKSDTDPLAKEYPGVELAYPLALASYDVAQKRYDALDNRLQTLIAAAVTISLAVPVLGQSRGLSFHSKWFIGAAGCFIAAMVLGVHARLSGKLEVINPMKMYRNWLHLSEWEFKKDAIYRAGEAFNENKRAIDAKSRYGLLSFIGFLLEAILLAAWAASF